MADATLTSRLLDTTVTVGDTAELVCRSDVAEPIYWYVKRSAPESKRVPIYHGTGVIVGDYKRKFSVKKTNDGYQSLVVNDTSMEDAGRYTCVDGGGFGDSASAELVVAGYQVV